MLRNQHGQWLDKSLNWLDHCPPGQRFKTPHHDVALNQLVELNARDISLRGEVERHELASHADESNRVDTSDLAG
ncbi:MAG: hypothetical protein R3E57_11365 [Porticoccaceae bacterium]